MGLNRAALNPGKSPARIPTLKLKASAMACAVITGVKSVGESSVRFRGLRRVRARRLPPNPIAADREQGQGQQIE